MEIDPNRRATDTFCHAAFGDGLTKRRVTVERFGVERPPVQSAENGEHHQSHCHESLRRSHAGTLLEAANEGSSFVE